MDDAQTATPTKQKEKDKDKEKIKTPKARLKKGTSALERWLRYLFL